MTRFTETLPPPLHLRLLDEARTVCGQARQDRRVVTGAVAALGVGLMLGVFLKPMPGDAESGRATASGVASVEPGLVRTEGVDILLSARASPEGRFSGRRSLLEAPVFGDPGPAPLPVQRVVYAPRPYREDPEFAAPEPLLPDEPPIGRCADDCLEVLQPEPPPDLPDGLG